MMADASTGEARTISLLDEIYANREEILRAFIAKYGLEPDEAEQVVQMGPMGPIRWFVRKKGGAQ